jgi:hypothetical protein
MSIYRRLPILGIAAFLPALLPAAQDQSIAVSATAIADYVRPADPAGGPRPESYVFAEGRFFDGTTVDNGLVKTTFADITRNLSVNLAKQHYFPANNAETADLIIMVHWGTTTIYEDPNRQFDIENVQAAAAAYNAAVDAGTPADRNAMNMAMDARATAQASVADSVQRNAVLLGYNRVLEKEHRALQPTNAEITMSNELNEERYFVILMAYDNHLRTKEHKAKLLWVTRLSVRSPGNNFVQALPALAQVGANVFGRQIDDLVRVKTPITSVHLGEMEVIGPVEDKALPPRKDK